MKKTNVRRIRTESASRLFSLFLLLILLFPAVDLLKLLDVLQNQRHRDGERAAHQREREKALRVHRGRLVEPRRESGDGQQQGKAQCAPDREQSFFHVASPLFPDDTTASHEKQEPRAAGLRDGLDAVS